MIAAMFPVSPKWRSYVSLILGIGSTTRQAITAPFLCALQKGQAIRLFKQAVKELIL